MARKKLVQGDLSAPGQWRGARRDDVRTANVSCPDCGRGASLSIHSIDATGIVTPSLVCPYDGCEFHQFVELDGWTPEVKK